MELVTQSLNEAVERGELEATPLQVKELVQGIAFYLTGSLTQFESQLIAPEYLGNRRETCYRHLARLMGQYKWNKPLTPELFESLEQRSSDFFDKHYRDHMTCAACSALCAVNNDVNSSCSRLEAIAR